MLLNLLGTCSLSFHLLGRVDGYFKVKVGRSGSFINFVKCLTLLHMSSQVKNLWLTGIAATLWGIWLQPNRQAHFRHLSYAVSSWIQGASLVSKGTKNNTVQDILMIKQFNAQCRPQKSS